MRRRVLAVIAAVLVLSVAATPASARVSLEGTRVRAAVVGQIDAYPCPDPNGCLRAVVEIRWHHARTHLVRCGNPRRLHVIRARRNRLGIPHAWVYACSRTYKWRIR